MNPFEQFIYQVATDSEFRCQIQNNSFLATGLSQEEKKCVKLSATFVPFIYGGPAASLV